MLLGELRQHTLLVGLGLLRVEGTFQGSPVDIAVGGQVFVVQNAELLEPGSDLVVSRRLTAIRLGLRFQRAVDSPAWNLAIRGSRV